MATDASGNIYITGYFQGSIDFGGGLIQSSSGGDQRTNVGFVASFTSQGIYRWATSLSGQGAVSGLAISVNRAGDVVVGGSYAYGFYPVARAGLNGMFLMSFAPDGTTRWAHAYPMVSFYGMALTHDAAGAFYAVTAYRGSTNFGGVDIEATDGPNTVLLSLTAMGTHRWSRRVDLTSGYRLSLAADAGGTLYLGTIIGSSMVLRSFTNVGETRWARSYGSTASDDRLGVDVDSTGNVFVTGTITEPLPIAGTTLMPVGGFGVENVFVLALTAEGTARWARSYPNLDTTAPSVDPRGNVRAAVQRTAVYPSDFGGGALREGSDWILSLTGAGEYRWSRAITPVPAGSLAVSQMNAVASDATGALVVVGTRGADSVLLMRYAVE